MFKKTDKQIVFHVSDRTLNNTVRVSSILVAGIITVSFFGVSLCGASDDITIQLDKNPLTTNSEVINTGAKGISGVAYSKPNKLAAHLEANTFTVQQSTDDNGIPVEILASQEFTPDGSNNWISCNQANVRLEPSVESDKLADVVYADKVIRLSYGSSWSKIRLEDGTEGYILSNLLSSSEILAPTATPTPSPTPTAAPTATPTPIPEPKAEETTTNTAPEPAKEETVSETELNVTVYASCTANLRLGPSTGAELVRVLNAGDEITVVAETSNGWYKTVNGNYIKASLTTTEKPAEPELAPESSSEESSSGEVSDFASYCLQYVGCPYVYAGASPSGFDCSGFVSYVYANWYGISLPHSADSIYQMGYAVTSDEMQVGDVVCNDHNGDGYIDHVSVYIGGGTVVHASTSTTGVITSNFSDLKDVVSIRRLT